jgi:hypothetical protein
MIQSVGHTQLTLTWYHVNVCPAQQDEWVTIFQEHDVWHTVVAKVDDM